MVLSIVFVFLSAEDFPIFLFSKINRSLSNIFKSMNRLLSLPTKIQIKNENTKNRSKDAEFSVKNNFLLKMHHLGTCLMKNCIFDTIFVPNIRIFDQKSLFLSENGLFFSTKTNESYFLDEKRSYWKNVIFDEIFGSWHVFHVGIN